MPAERSGVEVPHSRPDVGEAEIAALRDAVLRGWLSQGPAVERLELEVVRYLRGPEIADAPPGVAVSSGTAALYAALCALDVGPGDEVLVPAYACASIAHAVRHTGAAPRFVDCDPATLNADPDHARSILGAKAAAVVVAHLFGLPADVPEFEELGVPVVEDCAQAIGARLGDGRVGTLGEAATFSFHATKLVAGGEGGMVTSPLAELLRRVRSLRDCEADDADPRAFNLKMSDLHAAVASVQLGRLPELLERRRSLAAAYLERLERPGLRLPVRPDDRQHQFFRFVVLVDTPLEPLLERCSVALVACRRPVGRLAPGVDECLDSLPGCREAWTRACSLPLYPALTDDEADQVPRRFLAALEGDGIPAAAAGGNAHAG